MIEEVCEGPEDKFSGVGIHTEIIAGAEECRPPEFTDEALALQFAEVHADNLRYVADWGSGSKGTACAGNAMTP